MQQRRRDPDIWTLVIPLLVIFFSLFFMLLSPQSKAYIATGLFLDIGGVIMLFRYPPMGQRHQSKDKKHINRILGSEAGLLLIFAGFIVQFIGNLIEK